MMFLHKVIEHCAFGVVFVGTGAYVRGMCKHLHHKLLVGGSLLVAEALVTVWLIG